MLSFVLAGLMGVTLGLLGGGGSILTVPILRYMAGFEAREAIAFSLGVVGVTSLVGAWGHWRTGALRVPVALLFGAISMPGAYVGAHLSAFFSGGALLLLFGILMLAAAGAMFRDRRVAGEVTLAARGYPVQRWGFIALLGFPVGILTGMVGIGGGFMILPALVVFGRLPMYQAVGTSLLVIAMNAATGAWGYVGRVEIPWGFLAAFTTASVAGIVLGTRLSQAIEPRQLRRGFAVFLVVMGGFILFDNRAALPGLLPAAWQASAAESSR